MAVGPQRVISPSTAVQATKQIRKGLHRAELVPPQVLRYFDLGEPTVPSGRLGRLWAWSRGPTTQLGDHEGSRAHAPDSAFSGLLMSVLNLQSGIPIVRLVRDNSCF